MKSCPTKLSTIWKSNTYTYQMLDYSMSHKMEAGDIV